MKPNTCFENSAPPWFPLKDWVRPLPGGQKLLKASPTPSDSENVGILSKRLWGSALDIPLNSNDSEDLRTQREQNSRFDAHNGLI